MSKTGQLKGSAITRTCSRDPAGDLNANIGTLAMHPMLQAMPVNMHWLSDVLLYCYQAVLLDGNRRTALENFYSYYSIPGTYDIYVAMIQLQIMGIVLMWLLNRFQQGYSNFRYSGFDFECGAYKLTSKFINFIEGGM